ncbi:hypothetical protein [Bradyrhizobium sp. RD5-C2]|uniref:hypothetical protein n=1 Tax=Bradyrhizobium sp. RD5-C2 TaxID=244562 RepID=UPI001CC7069C|nr:hypothetical protein [Bradyrhizobium sp. RD5-C2]GIQ73176.1 hypothetical protein BraRD5C2_16140 [Bradyrhizobium sp. RD5-C2]
MKAMTPGDCRDRADHYRQAKAMAKDHFTRRYLAAMEHSYRVLAESEEAFGKAPKLEDKQG